MSLGFLIGETGGQLALETGGETRHWHLPAGRNTLGREEGGASSLLALPGGEAICETLESDPSVGPGVLRATWWPAG